MQDKHTSQLGRVLAIDDNALLLDALGKILAQDAAPDDEFDRLGRSLFGQPQPAAVAAAARPAFVLDTAQSGPEGLRLVQRACAAGTPYALALVDIRMPQWDGIQTAEALWQADPQLQVVFCTAYSDYAWGELADRLGRCERWLVLKKPYEAIEVRQLTAALAEKWRLQQAQRRQMDQLEQQVEERVQVLRRANRTLRVISRCHDALAHSAGERDLLDTLCRRLVEDGRYVLARMGLADQAGLVAQAGPGCGPAAPPWCDDLQRLVVRDARPLVSRYVDCGAAAPGAVAAAVSLPLRSRAEVLGTLCLYAGAADAFDDDEVRLLQELADEIAGGIASLRDAQARARAESALEYQANYDADIGLPRRALLRDRLQQAAAHAARAGRQVAAMVLCLDRFPAIREALGDDACSSLLRMVGSRIAGALPAGGSVAYLAGEEFAVALTDLARAEQAAAVAEKLLQVLAQPLAIGGQDVFVNASVGISLSPADGNDVDQLLRNAAAAAHCARTDGGSACHFYAPHMNAQAAQRLALEADLRRALAAGELELHYQPKVEMRTGRAAGAEALLRWRHPQRGMVMPGEFIAQAEESGAILPIGAWVIDAVCRQVRQWIDAGLPVLPIAINLSARQFRQQELVSIVRAAMQRYRVDAQWIELEVTESALMEHLEAATAALRELKATGVRLTLDDFGTGYSSLSHLQRFPVDYVKIDRAFVREVTTKPSDASICRSVIELAHALHLQVIAEGVETEGQVRYLRQLRCDELQGYYFSRAMPAEEFEQVLRGRTTWQLPRAQNAPERTLLLVDDEPNILTALRRLCRREGYNILTADNARDALELMAAHQVQVVLSDQRMPHMNGTEFLARARALQPDTIRMLLTGYTELDSVIQAINQGTLFKFLTKPWDDDAILAHLREAFDYHEMRARAALPG